LTKPLRVYYLAVFGAIAGLIGWQASNLMGLSFAGSLYLSDAIVGGLIGACLGLFIGAAEGLISMNLVGALRTGVASALIGLIAGGAALPACEWLFGLLGAAPLARVVGWMVLGGVLGLAQGVIGGTQIWKGILGGLLGGGAGGLLLAARWGGGLLVEKGVGMVLLGLSLGAFIGLIIVLLSSAWLEVTSGKLKGTTFILDKFLRQVGPSVMLGSSALKSDLVLPDPDVAPQHLMLTGGGGFMLVRDLSLSGTFINGRRIQEARLSNGQELKVGNTSLVFHARRSA
jgi:FHA domain